MSSMREMINLMESSISESKMSDIIIDAQQMSKEEFDAHYKGAWDYNEILADYPVDEAKNPDGYHHTSNEPFIDPDSHEMVDNWKAPGEGEYTYTLDYSGESQGYPHHELTITSPEGESKVVADKFTYFEVEGDELQAQLHSWFNMGHGVGDEGLGEADESFDPMSEPTQYDSAMDVYQDNGEDALAEYLGMSSQEFDQELNEYCIEHGLHADDDRDMAIHGMVEQMIDNEHQMADMREPEEMDEERVDEFIPVVGAALLTAARVAVPFLVKQGAKIIGKTATVGAKVITKAPVTTLGGGYVAVNYREELAAVAEWAKGAGANVAEIVKASKQYALPLLAVVAVLYGGKKIHDMITNKDPETQDELATENTKDNCTACDKDMADCDCELCDVCDSKGCDNCDDGKVLKVDQTNEQEELNDLRKRAGLDVKEDQDLDYGGHKTLSDIPYEEETEQTDGNISFSQSKSSDKGSVTIEASAENMEELHKVLALAGLEIPSTDVPVEEPSLDVVDVIDTDDEEPQVGDCGDTLSHDDVAYSTDKEVLKNYLQTQLKNRLS